MTEESWPSSSSSIRHRVIKLSIIYIFLQLLNDKSDEEDPEQRSRRNNPPSELLTQLLKEGGAGVGAGGPESMQGVGVSNSVGGGEDLLQLLGLGGQKSALKRKLMQEEQSIKRPHSTDPQQVNTNNF